MKVPDRFVHNQIMIDLDSPYKFQIAGRKAMHTVKVDKNRGISFECDAEQGYFACI